MYVLPGNRMQKGPTFLEISSSMENFLVWDYFSRIDVHVFHHMYVKNTQWDARKGHEQIEGTK